MYVEVSTFSLSGFGLDDKVKFSTGHIKIYIGDLHNYMKLH